MLTFTMMIIKVTLITIIMVINSTFKVATYTFLEQLTGETAGSEKEKALACQVQLIACQVPAAHHQNIFKLILRFRDALEFFEWC